MQLNDKNLKLAFVEALCFNGTINFPNLPKIFSEVMHEPYNDTAKYNYHPIEPIQEKILSWLDETQLDKITKISWTSDGSELIRIIWPDWDGEDDYFEIKSLSGIEKLTKLESLEIAWLIADNEENRAIVKQLEGKGVKVRINGKDGWAEREKITPVPTTPEIVIQKYYPAIKKDIAIKAMPTDQLQKEIDKQASATFGLGAIASTQSDEPTSVGGFRRLNEKKAQDSDATYYSVITKVFWSESELDNVSFYARYLSKSHCLTITGQTDKTDVISSINIEASDIAPETLDKFLQASFLK